MISNSPSIATALSRFLLASTVTLLALSSTFGRSTTSEYRGFVIDESRAEELIDLAAVRAAIKEQIDLVCSVDVTPEIMTFFQNVPLQIVPIGAISRQSPGLYGGHDKGVKVVSSIVTAGHKPILLHELLHAFHEQRLKNGFNNEEIMAFFKQAIATHSYAAKSHMMKNDREFFACAATTYLFGVTAQEPFRRELIRQKQPEFSAHLHQLLGPSTGNYAGSLTR